MSPLLNFPPANAKFPIKTVRAIKLLSIAYNLPILYLSADWFHHCSHNIASSHCHQYGGYQSICCRHLFRLLKGVWYCPPLHAADQNGWTTHATTRVQLAGVVLWWAPTPYCVQWWCVVHDVDISQYCTRLQSGTSVVYRHCRWPQASLRRQPVR